MESFIAIMTAKFYP